jgi:hypothetical protein
MAHKAPSNPLNFNPPLPASSDALAQRVVETRDALNAVGTVEYTRNPTKVQRLSDAYNRSLGELAAYLRVIGDVAGADTIANRTMRKREL